MSAARVVFQNPKGDLLLKVAKAKGTKEHCEWKVFAHTHTSHIRAEASHIRAEALLMFPCLMNYFEKYVTVWN